jgi:ABC-type transporter Mla subunit MlaD
MNTRYLTLAIFVTVCLSALVGLAWTLGALPKAGKTYYLRLADAGGLVEGNAVRIAGVQVGRIQRMDIEGNEALLELRIDGRHRIYTEVCASDQIKGMLGEKFLQLRQAKTGVELASGGTIQCVDKSVDMGRALNALGGVIDSEEALFPIAVRIMKRLDSLTAALDTELSTPSQPSQPQPAGEAQPTGEGQQQQAFVDQGGSSKQRLDRILGQTERLLANVNGVIEENRDDVRAIARGGRALVENPKIGKIIDRADSLMATLDRAAPGLLTSGKKLLADGERVVGELEDKLKAFDTGKINAIVDDAVAMADNGRKIVADLGKMLGDTGPLLADLKTIAHKAAQINEKVIREFLQIDGMRVRIMTPYGARKRVKELEGADAGAGADE